MMSEATLDTWSGWWAADPGRVVEQRAAEARMTQDADLIERCRHGDRGAWEHLVRSHTRLVYSACYRFTNQHPSAVHGVRSDAGGGGAKGSPRAWRAF